MKPWSQIRVLISGGSSGLGAQLVAEFHRRGSHVATFSRSATFKNQERLTVFQGDVSKKNEVHSIAARAFTALGGIDVLINNASSIGPTPLRPLIDLDCEDLEDVMQTNLIGPFRLSKLVAAGMLEQKHGLIVNLSSDAAINAYAGWGAYGSSKAALDHLTRILNTELAEGGVHAVAVDPGDMNTPMHFQAIPNANPEQLKDPALSARQLIDFIGSSMTVDASVTRIKL